MVIKKFLHSCLLIEEKGKRLLIDPGAFSFIEGIVKPQDIGPVDVIIYTHKHQDHLDFSALKTFQEMKKTTVVAHEEIGALLLAEGVAYERMEAGQTLEVEGFFLSAFNAPHEPIPAELPHNLAYLINNTLLHPGDSLRVEGVDHVEVVALPVAAPWLRIVDAIAWVQKIAPKSAIPIHDGFVKDFMRQRMYTGMLSPKLSESGIAFNALELGREMIV